MLNRLMSVALVALSVLVVVLARQNLELKAKLADHPAPAGALEAGQHLGPIRLLDANGGGAPQVYAAEYPRTLLLFFTEACPACRSTLPVWRELVGSRTSPVRVLGINLTAPGTGPAEALVTAGWPFPVFSVDPEQSEGLREITHVPATVIVDGSGVVETAWFGELDDTRQKELRRALDR